jgi:hypothetical protein
LRGNIYWRDNPEGLIIGYIEVATVTTKDRYIWECEGFYEPQLARCWRQIFPWSDYVFAAIYQYGEFKTLHMCVDCRLMEKATKLKPSGWPTDSL